MGIIEVGVPDRWLLVNTEGDLLGNVLMVQREGPDNQRMVVTVDLFAKPEPAEELFHDENTMPKVILTLYNAGMSFTDAGKIVDAILNQGVVFREIVRPNDAPHV